MGGELSLAHSSDSGSGFAVSLPLPEAVERPEPDHRMAGNNVLIASHSRFEAPYVGERLKCFGADVAYAASEAQALSKLAQRGVHDMVLVDCAFGESTTLAIAEAARQAGAKRLFILFSPTERRALHSDMLRRFDGWLVKPVRSASLSARFAPDLQQAGSEHHRTGGQASKLEGVSILLAEDNEISRRVALKHLERHGAHVVCASDGAEAVRLVSHRQFDAVILDVRMPVLDGLAAARRIRAAEATGRRTPLVALTANAFAADRRAAIEAGIDYFLAKPVDPFELVALIETALTRTQRAEALPRAS
jgi:CheY-like chemotaxis protein